MTAKARPTARARAPVDARAARGAPVRISWALVLAPSGAGTRLHLRLRISALGRRAPRLLTTVAGLIDEATVAPLFAGLAERVR